MAAPTSPLKVRWGFSEETTFGTAIADGGTFTHFEAPSGSIPSVDYGLVDDKDVKHRGYQMADKNDSFTSEAGGTRVFSFSNIIVRQDEAAILLYSVMQNMTEAAADPFKKDLTWASSFSQPDFGGNAGLFHTIGIFDTIASNHRKFTSCILKDLTLAADLNGDGRLRASGTFISGFASSNAANFSGTWAPSAQAYFNYAAPTTKTLGGANALISAFELTFNNNVERVGNDSSGNAENYSFGELELTGSVTTLYDANTDGFAADMVAGTARAIILDHGSTGVDPALLITMGNCEFTGNDQDYGGPARMETLPFKAMLDTSATAGVVIEVSDAIDRSW